MNITGVLKNKTLNYSFSDFVIVKGTKTNEKLLTKKPANTNVSFHKKRAWLPAG